MTEVLHSCFADNTWMPTENAAIQYAVLRAHGSGGATIFLKFAAGAQGAKHTHPKGEELYVVSGDISIGGKRLRAGDYLYTPPDGVHDTHAHEETVLLLNLPALAVFI